MASDDHSAQLTQLLQRAMRGERAASDALLPLVYAELRAQAGRYFRRQAANHTLQPTALVHEAFMRLVKQSDVQWQDRAHFFAVAAVAMRQILTSYARQRRAQKRGGRWRQLQVDANLAPGRQPEVDVVALDDALSRLAALDERKYRVVELRFFGGLSVDEVADVLGVSRTTVEGDWRAARAWLSVELS